MADEVMIPALPCASIKDTLEFYVAMGFEITYQQARPNAYGAVKHGGIDLHFFSMKGYVPADSYSTCMVLVSDADVLHKGFTEGLKAHYGKVPLAGIPRVTKPNNKNADGDRRFIVVDPGGNWIRFIQRASATDVKGYEVGGTKIAQALHTAGIMAESKGDYVAAAKLLDLTLAREANPSAAERVQVMVARAWVAVTMGDQPLARTILNEMQQITLGDQERAALAAELERADEIEQVLREEA
jgi:catechol 2,3-dioxygenase-like lactoylglutathione lyase family enzyme